MNREQAINYLVSSGMSKEQVNTVVEAFTCEDAISRYEVLKWLKDASIDDIVDGMNCELGFLPSIQPKARVGHWIEPIQDDGMSYPIYYQFRCSECGFDIDPQTFCEELKRYGADKFCPVCGAKMEGAKK